MTTFNRIKHTIDKFNEDCNGQANLGSPYLRADLAEAIYNAVMKQSNETETYNQQELKVFSNIDDSEHK